MVFFSVHPSRFVFVAVTALWLCMMTLLPGEMLLSQTIYVQLAVSHPSSFPLHFSKLPCVNMNASLSFLYVVPFLLR